MRIAPSLLLALAFGCSNAAVGSESALTEEELIAQSPTWTQAEEEAMTPILEQIAAEREAAAAEVLSEDLELAEAEGLEVGGGALHPVEEDPVNRTSFPINQVFDPERDACESAYLANQAMGKSFSRDGFLRDCGEMPSEVRRCLAPNFRQQNPGCNDRLEALNAATRAVVEPYLEG